MINKLQESLRRQGARSLDRLARPRGNGLLGLTIVGSRLEGAELRRTNGSLQVLRTFSVALSLDLLTDDIELVGREIRQHLDAAGVRERRCVVGLPLSWALTLTAPLPDLPDADRQSYLQLEAERGFPCSPDTLTLAHLRYEAPAGTPHALLVGIPRHHLGRLEAVLQAAQLRPVSLSLGIAALRSIGAAAAEDGLLLLPGETDIDLLVTCHGGVAVLRTLAGVFELEGGEPRLQAEQVARELKITLGQLAPELRADLRRVRVLGRDDAAEELAEALSSRASALAMPVEQVKTCATREWGVGLPAGTPLSAALALAGRQLAGQRTELEFLAPRVTRWQQLTARYSSGKLVWAGAAAAGVALVVALAFLAQQILLWRWGARWDQIKAQVTELESMQRQIRQFRPWCDDSFRSLSVLKLLTEAFPEDGTVSAKTVEIREPARVTCTGTAQDLRALLRTRDKLGAAKGVSAVQVEQIRGRSPIQFTVNFQWNEAGRP